MTDQALAALDSPGGFAGPGVEQFGDGVGQIGQRFTANHIDPWDLARQAMNLANEAQRTIDRQVARIARLERLLVSDELTGLLNRRGFEEALSKALDLASRHDEGGVFAYIDLDDFKNINDTFGHGVGDRMLQHIAEELQACVRTSDVVARLGGDEFGILLIRTHHREALKRARHIHATLNQTTLPLQDTLIAVSASLGAVTFNAGDRAEEVIRRADEKMYLNKKNPIRRHSHARQLFQDPAVEAEQRTIEVRAAIAV